MATGRVVAGQLQRAGRVEIFERPLFCRHTERRQLDRGMHKPVSMRQSPHSNMSADGRPCENPSIPVERCYPYIGELKKFLRERKKTLEDGLLCGKHKSAKFAKAAAVEKFALAFRGCTQERLRQPRSVLGRQRKCEGGINAVERMIANAL